MNGSSPVVSIHVKADAPPDPRALFDEAPMSRAQIVGVAMAVMSIGYPIGGAVAALLLLRFEWPVMFLLGAALALIMVPIVLVWLPESLAFLLERHDARSLGRVNRLLVRCAPPPVGALPPPPERPKSVPYRDIFRPGQRSATLRVMVVNLLFQSTVYFFLSWMPQMIADAGFAASTVGAVSAFGSFAGVIAALLTGVAAGRTRLRPLAAALMIGLGGTTALFGNTPPSLVLLGATAALALGFLNGGILGLYALIVETFEPRMRVTGVGFVIGIGRAGSAFAPAAAGTLFAAGAGRGEVSSALGAAAVLAGVSVLLPRRAADDQAYQGPTRYVRAADVTASARS